MQSPRQLEGGPLTVPLRFPSRTPAIAPRFVCQPPGPSVRTCYIRSPTLCSKFRMMSLTTSPIEITPTALPASSTGRWRKPRAAIIAMQPSSWSSGSPSPGRPYHYLADRSLLRIEPRQQHFYGAVTLVVTPIPTSTSSSMTSTSPDPVVAHLAQGFDDHVAGTNMDQGATLLGQSVFRRGSIEFLP